MTISAARQPRGIPTGGQFSSFPHLEPSLTLIPPGLKAAAAYAADEAVALARRKEFLLDQLAMVTAQQRSVACAAAAHRVLAQHPDATELVLAVKDGNAVGVAGVIDGDGRILPARRAGEWADSVLAGLRQETAASLSGAHGVRADGSSLRLDLSAVLSVLGRPLQETTRPPGHEGAESAAWPHTNIA
ncbi:hypothetical protein [Arthrobacter sp. UYCo732]|uniref:hypothetical protein n=1 Tax=Arthrobacter sp. UYCo732 TaxID=3156336 RepID=UPI0033994FD3